MTEKNLIRVYKGATSEKRIDINIKNYTKFIGMPKRSNTYPKPIRLSNEQRAKAKVRMEK
jgi:hypothetical protein|uniref:hypothetical protein n=1 Tax=Lachnospira eligens TaxID=39485 RepID=UPI0040268918